MTRRAQPALGSCITPLPRLLPPWGMGGWKGRHRAPLILQAIVDSCRTLQQEAGTEPWAVGLCRLMSSHAWPEDAARGRTQSRPTICSCQLGAGGLWGEVQGLLAGHGHMCLQDGAILDRHDLPPGHVSAGEIGVTSFEFHYNCMYDWKPVHTILAQGLETPNLKALFRHSS